MKSRIDDIEVLRGVAILCVLVQHIRHLVPWEAQWLSFLNAYVGGWVGVDLFFVISGFVIARSFLPQLRSCQNSDAAFRVVMAFWIRRAWRLLPSAWLWLLLILLASIIFCESGVFKSPKVNLEAAVAGFLNIANLRLAENFSGYGDSAVYWSLSLEQQFYLLFPLVVLLSRRWLVPVLLAIAFWQLLQERSMLMLVFRSDGLALGVLLAIWANSSTYQIARPVFISGMPFKGLMPLMFLLACMLLLGASQLKISALSTSWVVLLCFILVWIASYDEGFFCFGLLSKFMIWVGSRSYAIYIIHIPAFLLTREIWIRMAPGEPVDENMLLRYLLTAGALILLLSELNYRLLEMPLRKRGARLAARINAPAQSPTTPASVQASTAG